MFEREDSGRSRRRWILSHPSRGRVRVRALALEPGRRRFVLAAVAGAAAALLVLLAATAARSADDAHEVAARGGLDVARAAAHAWAEDAQLVYLENDETLDPRGAAPRWGYLFHSPSQKQSRVYSVRDGKILVAEFLEMKFEALPLAGDWIDSDAAFSIGEQAAGSEFRRDHQGTLTTMLLMRGAFYDGDPDQTTWTLVYTSPQVPSLFVMIDAAQGKVRRTWRG